ncbi:MAG: hypothetical protein SNH01_06150 [Rikenellaceae bacterium]
MSYIESTKSYTGSQLETIFFKPMLSGGAATELGIRVLYNMPVPTTINLWEGSSSILRSWNDTGWDGSTQSRVQKTIDMKRVKAEQGFAASDYFSMVFENLATRESLNMDDLTGTDLEVAETELFKATVAEAIRATMWVGDTSKTSGLNTFDGFLKKIKAGITNEDIVSKTLTTVGSSASPSYVLDIFTALWDQASERLKNSKSSGELAIFVTSDLYNHYELALDDAGVDSSYVDAMNGRPKLMYHGMEVIDLQLGDYLTTSDAFDSTFAFITDRRNLVMAVNTADFPGSEIRMWYNPDEMQNRQRAIFAAGCEVIDEEMVSYAGKA